MPWTHATQFDRTHTRGIWGLQIHTVCSESVAFWGLSSTKCAQNVWHLGGSARQSVAACVAFEGLSSTKCGQNVWHLRAQLHKVWLECVAYRASVQRRDNFHWADAAGAKCVQSPLKSLTSPAFSSFRG
eukprot:5924-Chlamydomonas_euryale.AAC.2